MGGEALQAEGPQGLEMGPSEGAEPGVGGCWASLQNGLHQGGEGQGLQRGLAVFQARGGGNLGKAMGVQEGSQGKATGVGAGSCTHSHLEPWLSLGRWGCSGHWGRAPQEAESLEVQVV